MAELPFEFKSLPGNLSIPVQITSKFGERKHPLSGQTSDHRGLDIRATSGTPALAVFAGIVIRSGLLSTNYSTGCGEGILIGHYTDANTPGKVTYTTRYCHLQQGSTAGLPPGTAVNAGDRVGLVGNTVVFQVYTDLSRATSALTQTQDPDAVQLNNTNTIRFNISSTRIITYLALSKNDVIFRYK